MLKVNLPITILEQKIDKVSINAYHYAVMIEDQRHFVFPEGDNPLALVCTCNMDSCSAVGIVEDYLLAGGQQAPLPPPGFYANIPTRCPICGNEVKAAINLSTPQRGHGWICKAAGVAHYWAAQAKIPPSIRRQTCHGCKVVPYPHKSGSGGCIKVPQMDLL